MSDPIYTARATIQKVGGLHRRGTLELGTQTDFGVHGPIKDLFGLEAPDMPLPVDYIVAAAGG